MSDTYFYDNKSFNIKKRKYIRKNKRKKNDGFDDIKMFLPTYNSMRCKIKSEINNICKSSHKNIKEYVIPSTEKDNSRTWWDSGNGIIPNAKVYSNCKW